MNLEKIPQEVREKLPPELLDHLAQELNKPIFGEKTIEEHMPALCRRARGRGSRAAEKPGRRSAPDRGRAGGCVWPGAAGLVLCGLRLWRRRESPLSGQPDGWPEKRRASP